MSAPNVVIEARAAGIRIRVEGDDLVLNGSAPPSPVVLELLSRHKPAIVLWLRPGADGWSGEDWWEFFQERAGIAEFDGGLPRDQVESRAFSCCVGEWLHRNPARSPSGRCDLCGESKGVLLPYLSGYDVKNAEHAWLHQECSQAWHQERRAKAVATLLAMGIRGQATCELRIPREKYDQILFLEAVERHSVH